MNNSNLETSRWNIPEKIALRNFFIYAITTLVPLNWSFYQQDFDEGFSVNSYPWRWLDVFSQNNPWFFSSDGGKNYLGWLITLLVCSIGGIIWTFIEKATRGGISKPENDAVKNDKLYNWFFILVRYQIALRMSWFAIAKVFPVQMPFPTLSQLNTNLGDFTPGKLYWLTTGVSPFFEIFAGLFELTATILILFRRTTTVGLLMMVAILLPIWFVNIGYEAGVELASLHILFLSLLLLAKDGVKFWDLLILHKQAAVSYIKPPKFSESWKRFGRIALKIAFIVAFLIYRGFEYGTLYADGKTFKLPLENGVRSLSGFYNVSEFRLNNRIIPYSPTDTLRWQNVVFEKFNSMSIKVAAPIKLNTSNKIRTTEYYGNVGRLFYGYKADTLKHLLILKNRADTTSNFSLTYSRPDSSVLILSGINEHRDTVHAVLRKVNKTYPLALKRTPSSR